MSINLDLVERLEKNPKSSFVTGYTIFLKLLNNIIDYPHEEKFRRFKKTNQRIKSEMLSVDGMEQLILDSGFEMENNEFVLRGGIGAIGKLKTFRDFYQKQLEIAKQEPEKDPPTSTSSGAIQKVSLIPALPVKQPKPEPVKIIASKPFHDRIRFSQTLQTNNNFLQQLEQLSDSVLQYEDALLQTSALKLIPTEKIKFNALEKLRKIQKLIKSNVITEAEPPLEDLVLEELAAWFKSDFFTWINAMPCKRCSNVNTDAVGTRSESGIRIEKYLCSKSSCNTVTEFPRYNDIEKLLVTRSGRCGEFANCFTFLCRCLGYDARYIYSTSDHVWTEVFNHHKKRWIHIDPSENVFDSPLMYEHGWKRKLDYVIAFSRDDVQDVTWRYSNKHKELLTRRKLCREDELISALISLRKKRQADSSKARMKFLTLRTLGELAELMILREPTENELKGRSSGSLSWRLERGEANVANFYVFNLTAEEKKSRQFNVRYSCAKNIFERSVGSAVTEKAKDWKDWIYQSENVFRKVEHDHKMAYLSRTEDSTSGMLQLKFDFESMTIKSIDFKFDTKTFESGSAIVELLNASDQVTSKEKLKGTSKFSIRVRLSGGKGDCAWQHSQVFRQSLSASDYPFLLSISFN